MANKERAIDMNKKISSPYKWSAIINIAVAVIAGIRAIAQHYFYFSLPWREEIFFVCALTILVCTPLGVWHWRKYVKETLGKTSAIWGIVCGLLMFSGILFPPALFLAILAAPFIGIFYARKYLTEANEISAPIIGGILGIFILVFAMMTTGGGHNYVLFCILASPLGKFAIPEFPGLLLLIPVWWAIMFFLAARSTNVASFCFIVGECIHFLVAVLSLRSMTSEEKTAYIHLPGDLPMVLIFGSIYMAPYAIAHFYAIRLTLRNRDASTKS